MSRPLVSRMLRASCFVAALCWAAPAQANSITFYFNWQLVTAQPYLTNPGAYGYVTLTDSLVDTRRVDIDMIVTPYAQPGATFEYLDNAALYLNIFSQGVTFINAFDLVAQNAAIGATTPSPGAVSFSLDDKNPIGGLSFAFDMHMGGANGTSKELHASLYYKPTTSFFDLNVDMFNFTTPTLNSNVYGPVSLYAGFQAHYSGGQADTSFGATGVPEPATLGLLGMGLFAIALRLRARRA